MRFLSLLYRWGSAAISAAFEPFTETSVVHLDPSRTVTHLDTERTVRHLDPSRTVLHLDD